MDELHLFVYGEIGDSMFTEGAATAEDIQREISAHPEAKELVVHISSPGGGVFEGYTIGNIIKNSGKKTTAKIEGFCASIATFIALSCDRVEMAEVGRFLIHNPTLGMEGEEEDLKKAADQLDAIKEDLINTYRSKTGMSSSQISKMMDEETSFTAAEAKAAGFIDEFMTPIQAVAYFKKDKKMATKKENAQDLDGILDKLLAKGDKLMKKMFPAKDITVELADGTSIFVESEDGELEGKNAFTVDEEGNATDTPVDDGTFALTDGRNITIEGGVVTSVAEDTPEEVVDKLKSQIKALEDEAAEATTANEVKSKETEESNKENEKTLTALLTEVKNLKTMTAGSTEAPRKAKIDPPNKFEAQPGVKHSLDGFAGYLNRNR